MLDCIVSAYRTSVRLKETFRRSYVIALLSIGAESAVILSGNVKHRRIVWCKARDGSTDHSKAVQYIQYGPGLDSTQLQVSSVP